MKMSSRMYGCALNLLIVLFFGIFCQVAKAVEFEIVSDRNCKVERDGSFSECWFPAIRVKELKEHFVSLPFETVIKVRPAKSCQLTPIEGALRVRLSKFGPEYDNFLRYEEISMDRFQRRILIHPKSQPLKEVSIYPRTEEIFRNLKFPSDCRIQLKVEINRTAIRSRVEADRHISDLVQQVESLKRAYSALVTLRENQNENIPLVELVARLQGYFRAGPKEDYVQDLRVQWNIILGPLREAVEGIRRDGYQNPEFEDLAEQIADFTEALNSNVGKNAFPPEGVNELLNQTRAQLDKQAQSYAAFHLDEKHLEKMAKQIRKAEANIDLVRDHLSVLFPRNGDHQFLNEDLKDALQDIIEGPQGVIDEFMFKLRRIGQSG